MDVKTSIENHNHHLKAALYFCELPTYCKRVQHHPNAAASRYILDLESDNKEKMQLELLKTNEKPFNEIELHCIKIFGDVVLLGGSQGFIGVGTIGMTTDLTMGSSGHQRVLYSVPCRTDSHTLQRVGYKGPDVKNQTFITGHLFESTIKCIAVNSQHHIFIASDDNRTISIWLFEQETSNNNTTNGQPSMMLQSPQKKKAGFYYNIKPQLQSLLHLSELTNSSDNELFANEMIVSLTFLRPDSISYLLVSTTKRLLLLSIGSHYEFNELRGENSHSYYKIIGYTELDRIVTSKQHALFSLAMFESTNSNTNNNTNNNTTRSAGPMVNRVNISNSMIGKQSATGSSGGNSGMGHNNLSRGHVKRILYWKALKNENDSNWFVAKCELSEEKIQDAIRSIRPLK